MPYQKISIENEDYVGAFVRLTDRFALIGSVVNEKAEKMIREILKVETARASVDGSYLVGIYAAANSNGIILPNIISEQERIRIINALPGINIATMHSSLNAFGSNILANDRIALINHEYSAEEEKRIGEALDVETVKISIGAFSTVGANNILTNRGVVANNRATDEELSALKDVLKMGVEQSTANTGSPNIGLCAIANSFGMLIGESTTGFEAARIANALELE